jgi:hypothetical protein
MISAGKGLPYTPSRDIGVRIAAERFQVDCNALNKPPMTVSTSRLPDDSSPMVGPGPDLAILRQIRDRSLRRQRDDPQIGVVFEQARTEPDTPMMLLIPLSPAVCDDMTLRKPPSGDPSMRAYNESSNEGCNNPLLYRRNSKKCSPTGAPPRTSRPSGRSPYHPAGRAPTDNRRADSDFFCKAPVGPR